MKTTCVPGVSDGVDRVAGGHQVYPRVEHRGRKANHRDAHREVQTRHEDARGPGVCTLRGMIVRNVMLEMINKKDLLYPYVFWDHF